MSEAELNTEGPPEQEPSDEEVAELLSSGEVEVLGRMPWSSNATFLIEASLDDRSARAIYKPHAGERPLWDFPDGLWRREVAAHELSAHLDWQVVPLTIERDDMVHGVGSLQRFIDADFEEHYFTMLEDESLHPQFVRMAAFDFVSNNADRKGGHCLIDAAQHVWGIDNGLSFHAEFKLRTVIWEFGGDPIPPDLLKDLQRLVDEGLPPRFNQLLGAFERDAVLTRARALIREGVLPVDETGNRYPWPLV